MIQNLYTFVFYPLLISILKIASLFDSKIKEGFNSRKNTPWLKGPEGEKWIWFHVASGELEYAKPVIREIKKSTDYKILVTYFSPSVVGSLKSMAEIDFFTPTPWDTPWHWNRFLKKYQPRVLAIARTDLWPNMIWQTKKNKIPSLLFSATLPAQSARVASFWGRLFYGFLTENLTAISTVTETDKDNFLRASSQLNISVDGDTRFDQVFYRLENSRGVTEEIKSKLDPNKPVFVAGSTWPEDEKVLVPALKTAVEKGFQVFIAPHEPSEKHLAELKTFLSEQKLESTLFTDSTYVTHKIIIVNKVGVLASLYALGNLAFVGGSFKKTVHSVMEPAAAGCLTLVGPFHFNNREALELKEKGYVLEMNSTADFENFFKNPLSKSKSEIQKYVNSKSGVSTVVAEKIKNLCR